MKKQVLLLFLLVFLGVLVLPYRSAQAMIFVKNYTREGYDEVLERVEDGRRPAFAGPIKGWKRIFSILFN